MVKNLTSDMIRSIRNIESALIDSKFDLICKKNNKRQKEIQQVLSEYLKDGETVTRAPDEYVSALNAIVVNNSNFPAWHVDYDLWINNKHSDLTMSLAIIKENNNIITSLEDLHVM